MIIDSLAGKEDLIDAAAMRLNDFDVLEEQLERLYVTDVDDDADLFHDALHVIAVTVMNHAIARHAWLDEFEQELEHLYRAT